MNDTSNNLFIRTILQSDIYCYPVLALWSSCFQIVWNYLSLPIFWIEGTWWLLQFLKLKDSPHGKQLGFSVSCGYLSASFFSLDVQMTSGRVRWNIHVSARHRGLLSGNDVHVRPGSRKLIFGRHLDEKSRLRRLFFGTIKGKWERHNSPTTTEVCIMCLVDILTRKFRLARLFWNDRSQMGEVEQPYNNGGLQHVHQTIYLWIIK